MAVTASAKPSVMVIKAQTGLTLEGSPILATKSIGGIKADATDQDIYDVAVAFQALSSNALISVTRENLFDLTE